MMVNKTGLSATQQQILLTQNIYTGSTLYNVGGYAEIGGDLNPAVLARAIFEVLSNADVIGIVCNEPAMKSTTSTYGVFQEYDIVSLDFSDNANAEEACIKWIYDDMAKPFEQEQPLSRVRIIRCSKKKYFWYVKMHHLIFDGYSMALFFNKVAGLYAQYMKSHEGEVILKLNRYAGFVEEEQVYRKSDQYQADRAFWISRLNQSSYPKAFQSCLESGNVNILSSKCKQVDVPDELQSAIAAFCEKYNCTVFHYFVAVLFILNRYYNNETPVIGLPVFNRSSRQARDTIGPFVNALPFSVSIQDDDTFPDLLLRIKKELKECYRHQHYPLYDILQDMGNGGNLYNVIFSYQKNQYTPELDGIATTITYIPAMEQQEDIAFHLLEYSEKGNLRLMINYKESLFSEELISNMARHFITFLNTFFKEPFKQIDAVSCLSLSEEHELLNVFNGSHADYPVHKTMIRLFEEQVMRTPDNIALVFEEEQYTYHRLNSYAHDLANYLIEKYNVGAGDVVGIKLNRNDQLVIAILAVAKAGGVYLPIDPAYPEERANYMKADSNARTVMDKDCLNAFSVWRKSHSVAGLARTESGDSLFCIIYTSGSTGKPKGCMLTNKGVVNNAYSKIHQLTLKAGDTICHNAELYFVGAIWQLWAPLLVGARVVLCNYDELRDIEKLIKKANSFNAKVLTVIPSQLNEYLMHHDTIRMGGIKTLILTGEKLTPGFVNKCYEANPGLEIMNTYGQTESSDDITYYRIPAGTSQKIIAAGQPVQNIRIYVVNSRNALCPPGVIGEICSSGAGVAKGYINNHSLTIEKFVPDLFDQTQTMFKTGDMGRWLPGGILEVVGRKDHQVKIRGYRVELEEIRSALLAYGGFNEVIVKFSEEAGGKKLMSYIISEQRIDPVSIRAFLSGKLPYYMVPAHFYQLEALPLLQNGKVDMHAITPAACREAELLIEYVPPVTDIEIKLAGIWSEVLKKDKIGIYDNFFDLGGHSLSAARVANKIETAFGIEIKLSEIFERPCIKDISEEIQKATGIKEPALIRKAGGNNEEGYILSSSQQGLSIISRFEQGNIAYNMPCVYQFNGNVDFPALRYSFDVLISRHESLRTVFRKNQHGETRQFIKPADDSGFEMQYLDLRSQNLNNEALRELVQEHIRQPFDLTEGPLIRAALWRTGNNKWIFICVLHHIITDGWSMGILAAELFDYYTAKINNEPVLVKPLAIQFKDYAIWEQEQMEGEKIKIYENYWINQFAGNLPVLEIPGSRPRPSFKTFNGSVILTTIDDEVYKVLKIFSRQQEATLFMSLLAAVHTLLYKYTQQGDIITGTPVAKRERPGLEGQIGFYVNTVALRSRFDGTNTFAELLHHVKTTTLGAYKYQAYPFYKLADKLNIRGDASRNPLFDVMVVLQNTGSYESVSRQLGEAVVSEFHIENKTSKFDLTFEFIEVGNRLQLKLEYNSDIYDEQMVLQMAGHLEQLMKNMLQFPAIPIAQLEYLTSEEKHRLLFDFNKTAVGYPANKSVVTLFEEQVKRTPDNIAVVFEGESLTYTELNERANQLAHYLRETYCIQANDVMAVNLAKSEWLIIAILGVLKSGAAYVPVDTGYPPERINYMISDSRCKGLLHADEIEVFKKSADKYNKNNPSAISDPNDLVYVIYTSGSTGKPKGSLVKQHSFTNLICWYAELLKLQQHDCVLLMAPLSFDLAQKNIFAPLITGARLCVPAEFYGSYNVLADTIATNSVTVINSAPSAFYPLLDVFINDNFEKLVSLKKVVLGGEPINSKKLLPWVHSLSYNAEVINSYGPTECTDVVSFYTVSNTAWDTIKVIPIGKPVNNCKLFILDEAMRLLPAGMTGEIYISGVCVGRGYLGNPQLTAEKFVQNPFNQHELMYRTGDLGKWLPDGNIEYVGRKDNLVKINGCRIEPGEIETVLLSHGAIEEAAVIARTDSHGEKELVACIVGKEKLDPAVIRTWLGRILPNYMVPGLYVQLTSLPVTPSGKLDKDKLQHLQFDELSTGKEYVAPRDEIEEKLVTIWQDVLGKEKVGIKDNFFDIGGHSLKATRLFSRIQKVFEADLDLKELFTTQVLEEQAQMIRQAKKTHYTTMLRIPFQPHYELSSSQRRLWILSQFEEGNIAYNMSGMYVFEGVLDRPSMNFAFSALTARHEILRTVFRHDEKGRIRQFILSPEDAVFRIDEIDLRQEPEQDSMLKKIIEEEYLKAFNLEKGPLARATLVRLGEKKWVFIYTMHHIIGDGWSLNVLINELLLFYDAHKKGVGNPLPPLTIQYKDYAAWQQAQLAEETYKQHKVYWLNQFDGELPVLELPADHVRPAVKTYHGGTITRVMHAQQVNNLRSFCNDQSCTLFMGLLAAVNVLLYRYTAQTDIVIGTPVAGRDHIDLENQLGFYVNTLALRTRFREGDSYKDLVEIVKNLTLDAYDHHAYPFDELIEDLAPDADISRNPLFDIMVVLQNTDLMQNELFVQGFDGLKVSMYKGVERPLSLFDLKFDFTEIGDEIILTIEYNSSIYNRSRIERLANHLTQIINAAVANPAKPIEELEYLSTEEQEQLLVSFNASRKDYPENETVIQLFEAQVQKTPAATALLTGNSQLTYAGLNEKVNQLAHYLRHKHSVKPGDLVGVLMERSEWMIISILGILKSGAAYVPVDPVYPKSRITYILENTGLNIVVTDSRYKGLCDELQWEVESFQYYVCVDEKSDKRYSDADTEAKQLWNYIAESATDAITASGWKNSYTGKAFSVEEMNELSANVYEKLTPHLVKHAKVLEVGIGSGLIMYNIAPHVATYVGTDISDKVLEICGQGAREKGLDNVQLHSLAAADIDRLNGEEFDIIIVNSVVQYFPSLEYLNRFLEKCIQLLAHSGVLFIGDIRDKSLQHDYYRSLFPGDEEILRKIEEKKLLDAELFLDKRYLSDFFAGIGYDNKLTFSKKNGNTQNELIAFRYDALIAINKSEPNNASPLTRSKSQDFAPFIHGDKANPEPVSAGSHLAYVIYTSGSTGLPKGVMISHSNVYQFIRWCNEEFSHARFDIVYGVTSICFDLSIFEMFYTLCCGRTLRILDDALSIPAFLDTDKNVLLNTVPSVIATLQAANVTFSSVNVLNMAGEPIPAGIIDKLDLNRIEVRNLYGPTEDTTYSTCCRITPGFTNSIGVPVSNTRVYILSGNKKLQPIGVPGELCISGAGTAIGYLNNIGLTNEKFVSNPFCKGEKMYKTGDLARWTSDGNIEFLGRKDEQVKIRGFRIEPGEIINAIQKYPGIEDVVVTTVVDKNQEKELAAYIVSNKKPEVQEMIAHLSRLLPAYMIPDHFIQLDKLPLTPNGKLDKKKLPAPGSGMDTGVVHIAPRNYIEEKLAMIWQEILGKGRVGANDNFLTLGGHSLKVTKLSNRLYKEFNVQIKLRELFNTPVLEDQALLIQRSVKQTFAEIPLQPQQLFYPLSSSQRRMWMLCQFEDANAAYNMQGIYVLEGTLNAQALEKAFGALIERHESLRTAFAENEEGELMQLIIAADEITFKLEQHDLRKEQDREHIVKDMATGEGNRPFVLPAGLLLRAALYRMEEGRWLLTCTTHHICSDGWSMEILISELFELYRCFCENGNVSLSPLRLQYKDYACWQQDQLQTASMEIHKQYWINQFEGILPVLEFPAARPRPAIKTYHGGIIKRNLNEQVSMGLKNSSRELGGTLFMGLLAAVNALLYKYTGQQDIIIGSPIAGREHAELANQVGFYVNTLALRTRFDSKNSYKELFEEVKRVTFNAYEHQAYPFDQLVSSLPLNRDISRSALFDVMVVLQNNSQARLQNTSDLQVKAYEDDLVQTSKFDLLFNFTEKGEQIEIRIEYNKDLYDEQAIGHLAKHFEQIAIAIVADPSLPVSRLNCIDEEEKRQLLTVFNDTAVPYPENKTVIDLFEEQVEKRADVVALVFEDSRYSYKELNALSNRFAGYIAGKAGIKKGDCIGVLIDRSAWSVISMISIMKLGCIYVPIDKRWPVSRVNHIIEESGIKAIIVDESTPVGIGDHVIVPIDPGTMLPDINDSNIGTVITADDVSYIIYTSGSTGKPKGIEQTHRTLLNLILWQIHGAQLNQQQKLLQFSSFSFDSSLYDVYYTFATGGQLHVVNESLRKDPWYLKDYLLAHQIGTLSMPYAALKEMFSEISLKELEGHQLKEIISTGEQLYVSGGLREFLKHNPSVKIVNFYGPSETHVVTGTWYRFADGEIPVKSDIGKPIHNTTIYILDKDMEPVPVGVEGEIFIGGWNLAKGYKNNPGLSAEKFIPDPFRKGERMYCSGDIGRWLPGGSIEYKMRRDNQIKINGYRIELEEIEIALRNNKQIEEAVVIAKALADGSKELVAYIVSREKLTAAGMRLYLSEMLPAYMIPVWYVFPQSLPLNSNGKVDKHALPGLDAQLAESATIYMAPRNKTEEKLVLIWQKILSVEKIGIRDNFFELGGNSLKVTRMISQIHREFKVKIHVKDIFITPTIEAIATTLGTLQWLTAPADTGQENTTIEKLIF
jgi:amino acid adenylation domain-containing protein